MANGMRLHGAMIRTLTGRKGRKGDVYLFGTMMCAFIVPAFMIHAPPPLPLSGRPVDCDVAPGTAIVMWLSGRACSRSGPATAYHIDPYSGFARVPSFSITLSISSDLCRSPDA